MKRKNFREIKYCHLGILQNFRTWMTVWKSIKKAITIFNKKSSIIIFSVKSTFLLKSWFDGKILSVITFHSTFSDFATQKRCFHERFVKKNCDLIYSFAIFLREINIFLSKLHTVGELSNEFDCNNIMEYCEWKSLSYEFTLQNF